MERIHADSACKLSVKWERSYFRNKTLTRARVVCNSPKIARRPPELSDSNARVHCVSVSGKSVIFFRFDERWT